MKKSKIITTVMLVVFSLFVFNTCIGEKPKTLSETTKTQKDSLKIVRNNKLDNALIVLEDMIKAKMKNPLTYEMINSVYDNEDKGNLVKLGIRFKGENSEQKKATMSVDALYNFEKDSVFITQYTSE